jgi:hypothetical protein
MANQEVDEDPRRLSGELARRRWSGLADDLRRRLGPGAALDPNSRSAFEGRLGGDLSGAMVHRSPLAGYLARGLGASALSSGAHVLGDEASLDQSTPGGAAVLGHELSHVLQRDSDGDGEQEAQVIERALAEEGQPPAPAGGSTVDPDALAERVYQRMLDQLRREHERAAWIV